MYQIDVSTAAAAKPASTAAGVGGYFTDGDVAGNVPPTVVPAEFLNVLMLELLAVLAAAGVVPSKSTTGQVAVAIRKMIEANSGNYATDTATAANAFVVALNPAVTVYTNGLQVRFRAKYANTGGCTLNAGAGAGPLLSDVGTALKAGDIPINSIVSATYDTAAAAFLLNSIVPSQFGAVAVLNIGSGLVSDGNGNLAIDKADQFFHSQN